jgi:MFS superfamily sulfate permease-like transporter
MVGGVVSQSDCDTHSHSLAPNTSFNHTGDLIGPNDVMACKLGVATATSLLVGVYQVLMGVVGLGCVTQYMPVPVMRGFVTGSAVHVAVSQLKYAFGIHVTSYAGNFKVVRVCGCYGNRS